jgi:NAD(P)H dehydrogenase (quinone)
MKTNKTPIKHILLVIANRASKIDNRASIPLLLAAKFKETALQQDMVVDVIDLYNDEFNPVESDEITRDAQVISYQKRILEAELVVFFTPIVFNQLPTILVGFLQKVCVTGFAYRYYKGAYRPLLTGQQALVFAVSEVSDAKRVYEYGNMFENFWKRVIFTRFGWKGRVYEFGPFRSVNDTVVEKWIDKAGEVAKRLNERFSVLDWF